MSHVDLQDEVVRLAEAQVAAGRAGSVEDVVCAGIDALELRDQDLYNQKLEKLHSTSMKVTQVEFLKKIYSHTFV